MRFARRLSDLLVAAALAAAAWISLKQASFIFSAPASDERALSTINTLESTIAGVLASLSGMMIAAYLISSQLSGRRPYSRLVSRFYSTSDRSLFAILLGAVTYGVLALTFAGRIVETRSYWLVDASVALFAAAMFALLSLLLRHLAIFDPRLVAQASLDLFTPRNVHEYGLVHVVSDSDSTEVAYQLRTWGHRHNLLDPLGPFHDIVREAVDQRERLTFHLLLACLMQAVANLNGVSYERRFALASGQRRHRQSHWQVTALRYSLFRSSLSIRVEVTVHALHYLVRRAERMIEEWRLDNHRQIFVINLADLILCLAKRPSNEIPMQLCIDAIARICLAYKPVLPYGSYEPLHELFPVAEVLRANGSHATANSLLKALAFLDLNTPYISGSTLATFASTLERLSPESIVYFNEQRSSLIGKTAREAFPKSLWV